MHVSLYTQFFYAVDFFHQILVALNIHFVYFFPLLCKSCLIKDLE